MYGWNKSVEKPKKDPSRTPLDVNEILKLEKEVGGSKIHEVSSWASRPSLYMPPQVGSRKRKSKWIENRQKKERRG